MMNAAQESNSVSRESEEVTRLLQSMPRLAAPYELNRSVRSELFRERRHEEPQAFYALWPAAAAVQLVLLAGLCALYFFATPPTAIVVGDSSVNQESSAPRSSEVDPQQRAHPGAP